MPSDFATRFPILSAAGRGLLRVFGVVALVVLVIFGRVFLISGCDYLSHRQW